MKTPIFLSKLNLSLGVSRGAIVFVFSLVLALFAASAQVAHAAPFTVTNLNDSGLGSLRQAITGAMGTAAADNITFNVSGTIILASTLPNITAAGGALTVDGAGQAITISGNDAVGVFWVEMGASLTLKNLTVANGGTGYGGGIYNDTGTVTITNSTFSGNSASVFGGGIRNVAGNVTITNSTFSGNSASGGGGISSTGTGNIVTITNSTFFGNSASAIGSSPGGGGIGIAIGTLTITNSTFSGNSASSYGGGIYSFQNTSTLSNTIFANNTAPTQDNCSGIITNGGNNIDSGTTCGWGSTNGSMSSTNPLLGPLAANGGPTRTMALLTRSPAIDGVTFSAPNGAPATDQRGVARPQGARYDIGAYEYQSNSALTPILMLLFD